MHAQRTTTSTTTHSPLFQPGSVPGAIADPVAPDANRSPTGQQLMLALRRHDAPAVRALLQTDPAAVRWTDAQGNTALHTAILSRCEPDLINTLLAHRADPAAVNDNRDTCMHLALSLRPTMPAVVQSLLDQGRWFGTGIGLGALGQANRQGRTALELGRDAGGGPALGHAVILPALESALVDWMDGFRANLLAAIDADDANAIRFLLTTGGWRLDMPVGDDMDVLQLALKYNAPRVACAVIDLAAQVGNRAVLEQPNATQGMTPLMSAVALKAATPFARLVLNGVPVDGHGRHGATALHIAAVAGELSFAKTLLAAGADPEARDDIGVTPMMMAAFRGRLDFIKVLHDAGGNINGRDLTGRTPLMHAHLGDQPPGVIFKIIMAGARTDMADSRGATVRDYQFDSTVRRTRSGESTCTIL